MTQVSSDHYSLISRQTPAGTEDRTEFLSWRGVKSEIFALKDLFKDVVIVHELAISYLLNKQIHSYFVMNERTGTLVFMRDLGLEVNESDF